MLEIMFTLNFAVDRRKSQEKVVQSKRWQIQSLVTCVPRHLQIQVALTNTDRPTVEEKDTNVISATSLLAKILV